MVYKQKHLILFIILVFFLLTASLRAEEVKIVRVGYFEKKPLIFRDDSGKASGLAVDILQDIARQQNWELIFIRGNLPETITRVSSGITDLIVPIGFTDERDLKLDFSKNAFYESWGSLYTLHSGPVKSLVDLENKRIGVVKSSLFFQTFDKIIQDLNINCEYVEIPNYKGLFSNLLAGKIDAAVGERLAILLIEPEKAKDIDQAVVFNPFSLFIAAVEGDPKNLLEPISDYLKETRFEPDSNFAKYENFWLSSIEKGSSAALNGLLYLFIAILISFFLYLTIRISKLRRAIGMTEKVLPKVSRNILVLTVILSLLVWLSSSLINLFIFNTDSSLSYELLPLGDPQKFFQRIFSTSLIFITGLLSSRMLARLAVQHEITKEQEERLNFALYAANDGIWDWHLDENRVYFDDRYYTMAGFIPGEFPATLEEWRKRVHPDDIGEVEKLIEKYLSNSCDNYDTEFRLLKKDGDYLWVRSRGKIVSFDEKGSPKRFLGTHSDITERKQIQEDIWRSNQLLNNVFDSLQEGIFVVDTDCRYTYMNQRLCDIVKISKDEMYGRTPWDVAPETRKAGGERYIRNALAGEATLAVESRIRMPKIPEGKWYVRSFIPLQDLNGAISGVVGIIEDINQKKQTEEMIIQSEKMLSVGGLAAGMAHEINNPLAGIMQTAAVMENRLRNQPPLEANIKAAVDSGTTMKAVQKFMDKRGIFQMLAVINESGKRVAKIVNNMLSFSRENETSSSVQNLNNLIEKTIELASTDYDLKKYYDFKKIIIERRYAENLPEAPCSGSKIQQVLLNIFRNAAQAMLSAQTEKPRLTINTSIDENEKYICIEIEDNGPGMDESVRKRVFEPFFTTKAAGEGTGLGLSVSYFIIVENHKGEMSVESQPGAGSKFIIRLPL